MIAFVDTSAFYAVLDRDDENPHAARKIWQALLQGDAILVTNNYVLLETAHSFNIGWDWMRSVPSSNRLFPYSQSSGSQRSSKNPQWPPFWRQAERG
jgi:hypothetical protein